GDWVKGAERRGGTRSKTSRPSARGEPPPYGMIGRVEETSASFEARSAPRSYPTTFWHNATNRHVHSNVRFSNRPFRVKRFQTIHDSGVNVARGLALLSGLGTKALPSWVSKTRWNNLSGDLAVNVTAGSSGRTNSPHPSSR